MVGFDLHPRHRLLAAALALCAGGALASEGSRDPHIRRDIERHRAMAQAHEEAARCLASGRDEDSCVKALQARCKGLGIGKYCGMKHEH